MLGGSAVGYARMTRRWWRPVRQTLQELGLEERPLYFVSSNAALDREPASPAPPARASRRSSTGSTAPTTPTSSPSSSASAPATPRARGRTSSTSPPASTSPAQPEDSDIFEQRSREERAVGVTHLSSRTALRVSAQVIEVDRLDHAALDPRLGVDGRGAARQLPGRDRQRRVSARPRRLQHPARDHRGHRPPARRLRARQGGDAERRRRRRDDLLGHPRRALGLDVLARQRVLGRRHRALPRLRLGPRQPARGHGQVDVPAEPRLPRLLLPRGVHGRRDGGRAVLRRGLRDRRRRSLPGRRGGQLLQAPDRLRDHPLRL